MANTSQSADPFEGYNGNPLKSSLIPNPFPDDPKKSLQIALLGLAWTDAVLEFWDRNPDMANFVDGVPPSLHSLWQEIETTRDLILHNEAAQGFRDFINDKISKAGRISNAINVGMGHPDTPGSETRGRWAEQFAAFLAICSMIEQAQESRLRKVFADPIFNTSAKYVIERLANYSIVEDGFAEMNQQSFVFGIHLPHQVILDNILPAEKHPAMYTGNNVVAHERSLSYGIGYRCLEQVYLKRTLEMPAFIPPMMDVALDLHTTHKQWDVPFDYNITVAYNGVFRLTYIYVRREQPVPLDALVYPEEKRKELAKSRGPDGKLKKMAPHRIQEQMDKNFSI